MSNNVNPQDPANWAFDVATSTNNMLRQGVTVREWTHVVISRDEYPNWVTAYEVAAAMASATANAMPTAVRPVY